MVALNVTQALPSDSTVPGTHFILNGKRGVLVDRQVFVATGRKVRCAGILVKETAMETVTELLQESPTTPGLFIYRGKVTELGPNVTNAIQDALALHRA